MKKLIVFDVDGTFLDSFGVFFSALEEYSKDNGLCMPCLDALKHGYHAPEEHDFKWGMSRAEQKMHLGRLWKITDARESEDSTDYLSDMFDGAYESLTHLKDLGYTLAIVTAKPEAPLQRLMSHHGLGKVFCGVRTLDDARNGRGALKPAPDLLQCVMRELKYAPEETVMIGDTSMDIEMGLNAGTSTIGVTWGSHRKDVLVKAGAHYILETKFADIIPTVTTIFE